MKKSCIVIILAQMMLVMLTGCGKQKIDLNKYITINTSGYDECGSAEYEFDERQFINDYSEKISVKKNAEELEFLKEMGASPVEQLLISCVNAELDKEEELKNGDVINLEWNCDKQTALEVFNVELSYENIPYTVSNLQEIEEFNPFDHIEVKFEGVAPDVKIEIKKEESCKELGSIDFKIEDRETIYQGDTICITAAYTATEWDFVKQFGKKMTENTKEYLVENVSYYMRNVDEIPNELMDKMEKHGEDVLTSYVARQQWSNPQVVDRMEYIGNYFMHRTSGKVNPMSKGYNSLIFLYEIEATYYNYEITYYYTVTYDDIIMLKDGTCTVDLGAGYGSKSNFWAEGMELFYGYTDLDSFFNNCIAPYIDKFEYTTNVNAN